MPPAPGRRTGASTVDLPAPDGPTSAVSVPYLGLCSALCCRVRFYRDSKRLVTHPAPTSCWPPPPEADAEALRAERADHRDAGAVRGGGDVAAAHPGQVAAATKAGLTRIAEIDELLNATVADDPLAEVVNSTDPVAM